MVASSAMFATVGGTGGGVVGTPSGLVVVETGPGVDGEDVAAVGGGCWLCRVSSTTAAARRTASTTSPAMTAVRRRLSTVRGGGGSGAHAGPLGGADSASDPAGGTPAGGGHSAAGGSTSVGASRAGPASESASAAVEAGGTGAPQLVQNWTSAGSWVPHWVQKFTAGPRPG